MVKLFLSALLCMPWAFLGAETNERAQLGSDEERQKRVLVERILRVARVEEFLEVPERINRGQPLNPAWAYSPRGPLTEQEKEQWTSFPTEAYREGLVAQFMQLFSASQLREAAKFYQNPFHSKILVILNSSASLNDFSSRVAQLDLNDVNAEKNKLTLLQSVINLHKINPLIHNQKEKLKSVVRKQRKLVEILKSPETSQLARNLAANEAQLDQFDVELLRYFARAFANARESELREMTRVMQPKAIQDAAQLLTSYHYWFMEKWREDLAAQTK